MDYCWFCMCFINVLLKVINNLKFYKCCFMKVPFQKHFCIIGWCLVRILPMPPPPAKEIDLKIYSLEKNPRLGLNS
jgi:hypothetical protein